MITFLDPKNTRTGQHTTDGTPQSLNEKLAPSWNFLLLSTDDATGFHVHLRFDGNNADIPSNLPTAGNEKGITLFLIAGSPQPVVFDAHKGLPVSICGVTGKTIFVSSAKVRTDSSGAV